MKIVLTHTFFSSQGNNDALEKWGDVPTGLCCISSYLQKAGLENAIVDSSLLSKEEWVSNIKSLEPKHIVFFTNWLTEAGFRAGVNLLKIDAALVGVNFIGVGRGINNNELRFLEMGCDVVIPGVVEESLTELLNTLEIPMNPFLDHVKGVAYINGRGELYKTAEREEFVPFEKFYRPKLAYSWLKDLKEENSVNPYCSNRIELDRFSGASNPWVMYDESESSDFDNERITNELKAWSENKDPRIPLIGFHDSRPSFIDGDETDFDFLISTRNRMRHLQEWLELGPRLVWIEYSLDSPTTELTNLIEEIHQYPEQIAIGLLLIGQNLSKQRKIILSLENEINWVQIEVVKVSINAHSMTDSNSKAINYITAIDELLTLLIASQKVLLLKSKWSFFNLKNHFKLKKLRNRLSSLT